MSQKEKISTLGEITLVTLQNCPSSLTFIADVFKNIAECGVNVDMVSLAPTHGATTAVSLTIDDGDLGKILKYTSDLQEKHKVKMIVSSGNCKISVYDESMKITPGIAAKVFAAASGVDADIRIITTSDVEISLLVTEADFDRALQEIQKKTG